MSIFDEDVTYENFYAKSTDEPWNGKSYSLINHMIIMIYSILIIPFVLGTIMYQLQYQPPGWLMITRWNRNGFLFN